MTTKSSTWRSQLHKFFVDRLRLTRSMSDSCLYWRRLEEDGFVWFLSLSTWMIWSLHLQITRVVILIDLSWCPIFVCRVLGWNASSEFMLLTVQTAVFLDQKAVWSKPCLDLICLTPTLLRLLWKRRPECLEGCPVSTGCRWGHVSHDCNTARLGLFNVLPQSLHEMSYSQALVDVAMCFALFGFYKKSWPSVSEEWEWSCRI